MIKVDGISVEMKHKNKAEVLDDLLVLFVGLYKTDRVTDEDIYRVFGEAKMSLDRTIGISASSKEEMMEKLDKLEDKAKNELIETLKEYFENHNCATCDDIDNCEFGKLIKCLNKGNISDDKLDLLLEKIIHTNGFCKGN